MTNIKKIIKEEIDDFEWAKGDVDLKGYVINFVPPLEQQDFNRLITKLSSLGIHTSANGLSIGQVLHGQSYNYIHHGLHFMYIGDDGRVLASSGGLYKATGEDNLADYMETSQAWNPFHLLDGHEVLDL